MISASTTGQETTDSRSVRDIVEHQHEQVNDAWCRKLFRQLLQSLERQYAMDMPHRAISADTVVFHQNGEPLLLPSIVSDPAPGEADDLTALAKLVHYAITQELMPTGPLHGRGLDGYSDALLTAVDRCMDPDPALRPQSIAELRGILGIVAPGSSPLPPPPPPADLELDLAPESETAPQLGPQPQAQALLQPEVLPQPPAAAAPTQPLRTSADSADKAASAIGTASTNSTPPASTAPADQQHGDTRPSAPARRQRWPLIIILLAILVAGYAALRSSGMLDQTASTIPQQQAGTQTQADGSVPATPSGTTAAADASATQSGQPDPSTLPQDSNALPAPANGTPGTTTAASPPGTNTPPSRPASTPSQPPANTASNGTPAGNAAGNSAGSAAAATANATTGASYRLHIQPWGTVYVDGIDRGVSPPIKRLQLPPGRHTVRVTNPNFQERVLDVDTANGDGRIVVDFSAAE